LVFERHHAGFPTIPPDEHRLMLHGMVERPLIFTMEDIVRFPSESKTYFLECSGNSALELKNPRASLPKIPTACCRVVNGRALGFRPFFKKQVFIGKLPGCWLKVLTLPA
jgi:DMSO/TMAO reductase YedYZ molybdopterin-dependent catalytic subunit